MKKVRFKFSKMLTDRGETQAIRDHMDAQREEMQRHEMVKVQLSEQFQDMLDNLRVTHKIPRGLTIIIDPSHMAEHDVVFLTSQETEEYEAEEDEGPKAGRSLN